MKHAVLIDKRVAGIIRWLERLKQSYSSGALESALMDAECARADLENLRQDVWAKVNPEEIQETKIFSRLIHASKIAFLAMLVVLSAVFPIAKDVQITVIATEQDKAELVLAEPILIVREDTQPEEKATLAKVLDNAKPKKSVASKSPAPKKNAVSSQKIAANTKTSNIKQEKTVAYDKVFSLVQTGQRALKNNSSVIEIK